jgi:hypothetical protein
MLIAAQTLAPGTQYNTGFAGTTRSIRHGVGTASAPAVAWFCPLATGGGAAAAPDHTARAPRARSSTARRGGSLRRTAGYATQRPALVLSGCVGSAMSTSQPRWKRADVPKVSRNFARPLGPLVVTAVSREERWSERPLALHIAGVQQSVTDSSAIGQTSRAFRTGRGNGGRVSATRRPCSRPRRADAALTTSRQNTSRSRWDLCSRSPSDTLARGPAERSAPRRFGGSGEPHQ